MHRVSQKVCQTLQDLFGRAKVQDASGASRGHRSRLAWSDVLLPLQIHRPQNRTSEQSDDVCARIWSLEDRPIREGMSRNLCVREEEAPSLNESGGVISELCGSGFCESDMELYVCASSFVPLQNLGTNLLRKQKTQSQLRWRLSQLGQGFLISQAFGYQCGVIQQGELLWGH